jgi:hypothetical protein
MVCAFVSRDHCTHRAGGDGVVWLITAYIACIPEFTPLKVIFRSSSGQNKPYAKGFIALSRIDATTELLRRCLFFTLPLLLLVLLFFISYSEGT